jgi:hypothetical protein
MVASPWILRLEPASKNDVMAWLSVEATGLYVVASDDESVEVDFDSIDDAFRCRMHFDADILQ